ncbi:MAG TPA: response regulator [Thermoflexales bacterium]|nr:response regulator [Thermoflexales bacterium]HQW36110.1 response regulator [Thermoflexales bacterium]HQX74782.1 response regulator [Thermoflexales bacterium]HQZ23159.1 response regulator [Thermoflexales bacterium]
MSTTDILKSVNYDMRVLANSLSGALEMLRDTALDRNQHGMVDQASEAATALLDLVNLTIDYDTLKSGQFKLSSAEFDLASLVEQTAESVSTLTRANQASLMTYISPDMPLRLRGDEARLKQVLNFLIAKAINRTPASELILRVAPDHALSFVGVNRVVLRFSLEQSVSNSPAPYRGAAQERDLAEEVVMGIVRYMHGEIHTESEDNSTSVVWFNGEFETVSHTSTEAETKAAGAGADDSFLLDARALVVDDSKANRDVLYYYMRSWGLHISQSDCAASGAEALETLQRAHQDGRPYDVAILDLAMPEMDGLELARAIRKNPAIARISLVLLTAFDQEVHREEAESIGFSAFLTKPVRQSQLLDAIASAAYEQRLPEKNKQTVSANLPPVSPVNPNSHHILIAEDNLANQKLALAQLERLGYTASAVGSGSKAIEEYHKNGHLYSLILMDCQMPDVDGFSATRAIRQDETINGGHIPIIAMTATVTRGAREMCLDAGMDDYLSKPVSRDALHNMLMRWIDA